MVGRWFVQSRGSDFLSYLSTHIPHLSSDASRDFAPGSSLFLVALRSPALAPAPSVTLSLRHSFVPPAPVVSLAFPSLRFPTGAPAAPFPPLHPTVRFSSPSSLFASSAFPPASVAFPSSFAAPTFSVRPLWFLLVFLVLRGFLLPPLLLLLFHWDRMVWVLLWGVWLLMRFLCLRRSLLLRRSQSRVPYFPPLIRRYPLRLRWLRFLLVLRC